MAGIARVNVDSAGGKIIGALVPKVRVNGAPIAVVGAAIAPHGQYQHAAPVMVQGSAKVRAGGLPVCRAGDEASCGHAASGSSTVSAK